MRLTVVGRLDEEALKKGFDELDDLADIEYRQKLAEVVGDADATRSAVRVGRLVGVILKEPFATPVGNSQPSQRTAAYRSWTLLDEAKFGQLTGEWQYYALDEIRKELVPDEPYMDDWSVYWFAFQAHNEKGYFGFFGRAVRKHICGDAEIRRKVDEALKEASKAGATPVTPEYIVGAGGLGLGVFLVGAVPFLGFFGAPVIAGLVVILYRLGVEGFCDWTESLRTDEDEKY